VRIVALSDTHSFHRRVQVPEGDLLIHAGDISWRGELEIMADFANWLGELPHANKLCIFGNHEVGLRSGPNRGVALRMIQDTGATYLEDSGTVIEEFNVYGSPATPSFGDGWEWNYDRGMAIGQVWKMIPDDTHILITHGMPNGILDSVRELHRQPQGCEMLKRRIRELTQLKLFVGGHLHKDGCSKRLLGDVWFVNAAICDDAYDTTRSPVVIDL
jgi:predicted phosphodiesterase